MALPDPPKVELEIVNVEPDAGPGFLRLKRYELAVRRDGGRSSTFLYDVLDRRALDACVMVAHHLVDGRPHVWLRTAIRPPVALRPIAPSHSGSLWEVPAGLVEPGESPRAAAAREVDEELGFQVDEAAMQPLGEWSTPAPGFIGEMHWYFHVRVDPSSRREPDGDGSPLEQDALVLAVPLEDAIAACRAGEIRDAKTELALRRLAEVL